MAKSRLNLGFILLSIFISSSTQVAIDKIQDVSVVKSQGEQQEQAVNTSTLEWTPELENPIWQELNFPVEPEEPSVDSGVEGTTVSVIDANFDINEYNLTALGDATDIHRVAGGRATCQCGRPLARIVDGIPAKINDIPWTVGLVRKGSFNIFGGPPRPFCGGTLINDRYIVTASHCVDGQTAKGINVLLNEQDLLISTETIGGTKTVGVEKIIMHPGYSRRTVDNDIALIKLDTPVEISVASASGFKIVPACLPANNNNDFNGITATVAGWGTTKENGNTATSLQKVSVPIITNAVCNSKETKYNGKITDSMLCAGFLSTGGKDACQGDSGGPLIIDNGTRKTLVGVVSWGYGCAQKRAPGVYNRVAKYPDWILANTRDADWCSE